MNFIKNLAAIYIVVILILNPIFNYIIKNKIDNVYSTDRWELLENNIEGGWSYWRDKKNPDLCFIQRDTFRFIGLSAFANDAVSYVPCDKIVK